ncbi:NAD-dependent malic enzyme, mitochondrial [Aspergillus hancockii]|nr:NAD-dependent malic enzyme, mitochondrial [Aspergillus hancockii]
MSKHLSKFKHLPRVASGPLECPYEGKNAITSSQFNKGSAFTEEERKTFKLHGLLPPNIQTLEEQVQRASQQYKSRPDDLAKNTFMASMKAQNEVLYYKDRIEECLGNFGRGADVDYIVVSDGEEILGIGDQGVGSILISVAKLVLTTLCAGIHPSRQLPVVLDCGTDNESLLNDELYLGLRQQRVRGKEYDQFVNKFVTTARKMFPKAYIHFEDFGLQNARRLLDQYRPHIPCFNDDIQGTGCVTLAALMAAFHVGNMKLADVRVAIFGSGSAGIGIAEQITDTLATETGRTKQEASRQIWCLDKPGLLRKSLGDQLTAAQAPFARNDDEWPKGPKAFTEDIIREMAKHVEHPIIFPLSNPTRLHEASPEDINLWTDGRALISTGSPFPPVERNGVKYEVAECNNSTCFPGIGLGVILSRARILSDKMLVSAAKALASQSPALRDPSRPLLPDVENVREISVDIARAIIKTAIEEGHAQEEAIPTEEKDLEEWIRRDLDTKYAGKCKAKNAAVP